MLWFAEVDAECAEALGNAYKAKRCPPKEGPKRGRVSFSSLKGALADEDTSHSLQTTPRTGVCALSTAENAVDLAKVHTSSLPGSQSRMLLSDQQSHSSVSIPLEAFAPRSSAFNADISSGDLKANLRPENSAGRYNHSFSPTTITGMLGRLNVLISDTVVNEDGTYSSSWLSSAHELQRICEGILQNCGESVTDPINMKTMETEIKGAASLLQFIKDVKGNECELLMRKYSYMAHRLYDYIKKLTMQETSSRTGAEYSTDFPNNLLPMPSKAAQEGEGFHPLSSGMVGPNEYKSYMGVQYNHIANNPYAYTQPCLNTPAMLNVRQPPYGNVLPVPSSVMPQCQPYLCGPTPTLMQDGAPVQAVMQHPPCSPMHSMMPRYSPLFGCSYEEKYYTPALMNTHVAGPWNAHTGEMNNNVNYPTGYTPIIDCLGGVPRIQ